MKFCHCCWLRRWIEKDWEWTRWGINGQISGHDKINYYSQLTLWNSFIASLDRFYMLWLWLLFSVAWERLFIHSTIRYNCIASVINGCFCTLVWAQIIIIIILNGIASAQHTEKLWKKIAMEISQRQNENATAKSYWDPMKRHATY